MDFLKEEKTYEEAVADLKTAVEKWSDDSISINNVIKKLDKNILAIALANLLHREVIEDAHSKYNISQKDMCEMNRCAVNRARCFLEFLDKENDLLAFQGLYALATYMEWDDPVSTEDTTKIMDLVKKAGKNLNMH